MLSTIQVGDEIEFYDPEAVSHSPDNLRSDVVQGVMPWSEHPLVFRDHPWLLSRDTQIKVVGKGTIFLRDANFKRQGDTMFDRAKKWSENSYDG
jgi:hypothetical protein